MQWGASSTVPELKLCQVCMKPHWRGKGRWYALCPDAVRKAPAAMSFPSGMGHSQHTHLLPAPRPVPTLMHTPDGILRPSSEDPWSTVACSPTSPPAGPAYVLPALGWCPSIDHLLLQCEGAATASPTHFEDNSLRFNIKSMDVNRAIHLLHSCIHFLQVCKSGMSVHCKVLWRETWRCFPTWQRQRRSLHPRRNHLHIVHWGWSAPERFWAGASTRAPST